MGILDFLGGGNSHAYNDYADQLRGLAGGYDPYTKSGLNSLHDLMGRYQQGLNNPGFLENELAGTYQESPYAQAQSKYLTSGLNNNAAALGSLGSTYSANNMADSLHRLISSDEGQYINRGINTYNNALGGESHINDMGYNALGAQNKLNQSADLANMQGSINHTNALQHLLGGFGDIAGDVLSGGTSGLLGALEKLLKKGSKPGTTDSASGLEGDESFLNNLYKGWGM